MIRKDTPILISGFGSIGKRHYRNLRQLGYSNLAVFDPVDTSFDGMEPVTRIPKLDLKTAKLFRIALICTPNHLHIAQAIVCAKAACDVFVEKPLSHSMKGIREFLRLCQQRKIVTMVGCNMRYHPCLCSIKQALEQKKIGRVYSIRHEYGSYLPNWRPKQDYRKNYAARRSTGGGIILDDIHEFDLLFWLNGFAAVTKKCFTYGKVSNLEINTEDMCLASFTFANRVLGSVSCDYLQQRPHRSCTVIGEKGNLRWSMEDQTVWHETRTFRRKLFAVRRYDSNTMYLDELRDFLRCVDKRATTQNSFSKAAKLLSQLPL